MSPNSLKSTIIKSVTSIEDILLLKQINALLVKSKKDVILNIPKEQEKEINLAKKQFESGECATQESVEKRFSKWKN